MAQREYIILDETTGQVQQRVFDVGQESRPGRRLLHLRIHLTAVESQFAEDPTHMTGLLTELGLPETGDVNAFGRLLFLGGRAVKGTFDLHIPPIGLPEQTEDDPCELSLVIFESDEDIPASDDEEPIPLD